MPLNSEIANLMVQAGRDRAAGIAGSADAWSHAVSQIGQQVGQLPQQVEAQKQRDDLQRARDARNALSDAMKDNVVAPVMQDGLKLRDVNGIGTYMASKGFGAEFVPAAQHLDAINQSMIGFQQARLGVVQSGAKALLATTKPGEAPDPKLVSDFLDQLDHNQVYAPATVATYRKMFEDDPTSAATILRRIAGPQKLTSGDPGSVMRDESGQIVPGSQVPNRPVVVNGQVVQPDTGLPIGAPVPKQATPLAPEEIALKLAQLKELNAKLNGTLPMSEKDRADLKLKGQQITGELLHWRNQDAAANPFGALTGGAAGGTGAGASAPTSQTQMPTGEAFLKTLPPNVAQEIKSYAEGKLPFPTGMSMAKLQPLIQMVGQYDPTFDAVNYTARSKTRNAFTSGKEAAQVNALNTVLGHLDKLSDAAEALKNSDIQGVNAVTNWFSKQFGSSTVTNFDTVKKAVADEVTRVWRQAGGSVEDIRAAQENLKSSNSPEQLRGAIATYGELLHSKLESLQDQYKQGMGTDAVSLLRPESQKVLDKISSRAVGASVPTSDAAKSAGSLSVDDVKQIAARSGKTYAEAKAYAESQGYIVK